MISSRQFYKIVDRAFKVNPFKPRPPEESIEGLRELLDKALISIKEGDYTNGLSLLKALYERIHAHIPNIAIPFNIMVNLLLQAFEEFLKALITLVIDKDELKSILVDILTFYLDDEYGLEYDFISLLVHYTVTGKLVASLEQAFATLIIEEKSPMRRDKLLNLMGHLYLHIDDYEMLLNVYDQMTPCYLPRYDLLSTYWLSKGDITKAINILENAIDICPSLTSIVETKLAMIKHNYLGL